MYTLDEIQALRKKCSALKLHGYQKLYKYDDEELQKICNGIGPELLPKWMRSCITSAHPTLEPAAMIHDVEYHESEKDHFEFCQANRRFKENGYILAKANYGWYNPIRYIVMNQARRLGNYCQLGGWLGYCQCCDNRKERGDQ